MKQDFYKSILENIKDGVYFVDKDRKITFWNKGAEEITGFLSSDVIGCHCYDNLLNHVDENGVLLCKNGCPLHKTLEDGEVRSSVVYLDHEDGHRVKTHVHIVPIYEGDEIVGAVESFNTDAERVELNHHIKELRELAYTDQLTGLPNRRYLDLRMEKLFEAYIENGKTFGVGIIDVDFFKKFNDEHGHDVGDQILIMLAKIFKGVLRGTDVIGRWGGEEFLVVVEDVSKDKLNMILERLRILVERSSLRKYNPPLKVTVSIGATIVGNDTAESLFKRADTLLYRSKSEGRNKVTVE